MFSNIANAMINFRVKGLNSCASFLFFSISVNPKSPHILNASSNLLGLCFIMLTCLRLLKVGNRAAMSILATVANTLYDKHFIVVLIAETRQRFSKKLENIPDYIYRWSAFFVCNHGFNSIKSYRLTKYMDQKIKINIKIS